MNIDPSIKEQALKLAKSSYLYYFDLIAFIAYFVIFIVWIYALVYFYKKLKSGNLKKF